MFLTVSPDVPLLMPKSASLTVALLKERPWANCSRCSLKKGNESDSLFGKKRIAISLFARKKRAIRSKNQRVMHEAIYYSYYYTLPDMLYSRWSGSSSRCPLHSVVTPLLYSLSPTTTTRPCLICCRWSGSSSRCPLHSGVSPPRCSLSGPLWISILFKYSTYIALLLFLLLL